MRGVFFFGEESVSLFQVMSGYLGSGLEAVLLLLLLLEPAEARPCSRPVCSAGPPTGDPKNPQPDASSSGAAPAQVTDLLTSSAAAYLLRGHGSRRAVLFASWFGSAASAQPLVISAIDLLQMS